MVPGSESDGGVVSCTVTEKPIVDISIVRVSVNVQDTEVVPMGNVPGPGEHEAAGVPLSSMTPLRSKVTAAPLAPVASTVTFGTDPVGGSAEAGAACAKRHPKVAATAAANRNGVKARRDSAGSDPFGRQGSMPQSTTQRAETTTGRSSSFWAPLEVSRNDRLARQ